MFKIGEKTNNDRTRGMIMQNKVAIQKSKGIICDSWKSTFLKQNLIQKYWNLKFVSKYKSMLTDCLK